MWTGEHTRQIQNTDSGEWRLRFVGGRCGHDPMMVAGDARFVIA